MRKTPGVNPNANANHFDRSVGGLHAISARRLAQVAARVRRANTMEHAGSAGSQAGRVARGRFCAREVHAARWPRGPGPAKPGARDGFPAAGVMKARDWPRICPRPSHARWRAGRVRRCPQRRLRGGTRGGRGTPPESSPANSASESWRLAPCESPSFPSLHGGGTSFAGESCGSVFDSMSGP